MLRRFPLLLLLAILIAMVGLSCAPGVRDMNLSQEVVDDLPKDQALSFLQSLRPSPLGYIHCRFEQDGVLRWLPQRGQLLPGKRPYGSFYAQPQRPGIMIVVFLYESTKGQPWCIIPAESNADDLGKDATKFTGKILTALLSMGVRVRSFDGEPIQARRPAPK